jgi:hypothetical protein
LKDPRLKDSVSGEKGLGSINSLPNFLSCIAASASADLSQARKILKVPAAPLVETKRGEGLSGEKH